MKKNLTVDEWCRCDGREHDEIARDVGISRSQLYRIRAGGRTTPETAAAIQRESRGRVKATVLLGVEGAK